MAKAKTRRSARAARSPDRCVYRENGRQCLRHGLGNPPICRAHRVVLEEQYEREQQTRRSGIGRVITDWLNGRSIREDDVFDAVGEIAGAMGGARVDPRRFNPRTARGTGRSVPSGSNGHARRPPLESDPDLEERKRLLMARQELGFQPREPLTVAAVEKRRKELARKHHPDLGGAPERMVRINQAADLLVSSGSLG